jgi:hypothetical protein
MFAIEWNEPAPTRRSSSERVVIEARGAEMISCSDSTPLMIRLLPRMLSKKPEFAVMTYNCGVTVKSD